MGDWVSKKICNKVERLNISAGVGVGVAEDNVKISLSVWWRVRQIVNFM